MGIESDGVPRTLITPRANEQPAAPPRLPKSIDRIIIQS